MKVDQQRRGFALRDLIVCLCMSGIGMAVAVPGCGRQQGNYQDRWQTQNHLRQLGIAIHNAESANKKLPPAFGSFRGLASASIHVHLLPFVEQAPLYEASLKDPTVVDGAIVPQYLTSIDPTTVGGGPGQTNFAANIRVFSDAARRSGPTEEARILASDTVSFGLADGFPDGHGNTIILATRYSQGRSGDADNLVRTLITGDPTSPSGAFFGGHRPRGTAQEKCPRGNECTFQSMPSEADAMMTASHYGHSYSEGGLTVCTGDVIVRQVNARVSVQTWQYLVHPDDRQSIDDPEW